MTRVYYPRWNSLRSDRIIRPERVRSGHHDRYDEKFLFGFHLIEQKHFFTVIKT